MTQKLVVIVSFAFTMYFFKQMLEAEVTMSKRIRIQGREKIGPVTVGHIAHEWLRFLFFYFASRCCNVRYCSGRKT